jgi:hypothetical protein
MEYETTYDTCAAGLFPQLAWVACKKGACGDDTHARGATPEEAIENLKEMLDEVDWEYERRETARLDAMYDDRYSEES